MLLSILIPGKNDNFYNCLHKLKLNIDKTLSNIEKQNTNDVELILCDWGSETKITNALNLTTNNFFKCAYVSPEIAKKYNKEANYSIVHPINTAFRRSCGKFVVFWDSDCYVSYESYINLYNFVQKLNITNSTTFYWGSRYNIPYTVYEKAKTYIDFDNNLQNFTLTDFHHDKINIHDFLGTASSILMKRDLWESSTGWWEELTYWGWQDIEFHYRLKQQYQFGGDLEDQDILFYHLCNEPQKNNELYSVRKTNNHINSTTFQANNDEWGLINEPVIIY